MSKTHYGSGPLMHGHFDLDWHEYMHYMYLPVYMGDLEVRLPERLEFVRPVVELALERDHGYRYAYVTARRGFATPGNPLNRPGWHTDGFGSDDVNYVWTDRYPTRFAIQLFDDVSDDHVESIRQFEEQVDPDSVMTYPLKELLRLDPYVVHAAPEIPEPGGERSFLKVSLSNSRFNLLGNSHNYLFDYDWRMWSRQEVRNHPSYAGGDAGPA